MNILFIGYWGMNEGLTAATIFPHLEILSGLSNVNKIVFCSIERNYTESITDRIVNDKVQHIPLISRNIRLSVINKFSDFVSFRNRLLKVVDESNIHMIICRGAPAGALGYLLHKRTQLPFYVESFEPHGDYMLESGVWNRYDPKYILEAYWEEKQKTYAKGLMPVARNYKEKLVLEGVDEGKIDVIPCCVPVEKFEYSEGDRLTIRQKLGIGDEVTAVYAGKFGGIYYSEEAFQVFKATFDYFGNDFRLIILTPDDQSRVKDRLNSLDVNASNSFVDSVPHDEVPAYLSAADFAFALYKPSISKKYLSPIKNGEYWANGLPVILTVGIGDDSRIISAEGGGATFSLEPNTLKEALVSIEAMIKSYPRAELSERIRQIAFRHRSFDIAREVYEKVYGTQPL